MSWAAILGGICIVIGVFVAYRLRNEWKVGARAARTELSSPATVSPGKAAIEGRVEPISGQTMEEPFGDDDCVYAEWEVEEYRNTSGGKGGSYHTIDEGEVAEPFLVSDGGSTITVLPSGIVEFYLDRAREPRKTVRRWARSPDDIREFERERGIEQADPGGSFEWVKRLFTQSTRRYTRHVLYPGDEVYVHGEVSVADSTLPTRYVIEPLDHVPMLVSDLGRSGVTRRRWRAVAGVLWGGGLAVAGGVWVVEGVTDLAIPEDVLQGALVAGGGLFVALVVYWLAQRARFALRETYHRRRGGQGETAR